MPQLLVVPGSPSKPMVLLRIALKWAPVTDVQGPQQSGFEFSFVGICCRIYDT